MSDELVRTLPDAPPARIPPKPRVTDRNLIPGARAKFGRQPMDYDAFADWARRKVAREGRTALMKLAREGEREWTRMYAWRLICEYGFGKPKETLEIRPPIRLVIHRDY